MQETLLIVDSLAALSIAQSMSPSRVTLERRRLLILAVFRR